MNTVVYRPFSRLNRIFDDRFFPVSDAVKYDATDWVPRVDIREEENSFIVDADVPGVSAENIDITLDKGVLTIRGSRTSANESFENGYARKERFAGTFTRQFTLPETADGDNISARSENGVLTVTIPKTVQSQPKTIQVLTGS